MRKKLKLIGITAERCSRGDGRSEMGDGGGRTLSTFHLKPPAKQRAFTLIEMIGVMAIMGILAAIILPPMIAKIEEADAISEDATQEAIAQAILKAIKANAQFPNPNVSPVAAGGWVTLAKGFYPGSLNSLRYVFPEAQNFAQTERRVYLDPALLTYLGGSLTMPATGFSSTDSDGDGVPNVEETALRMYIVSSSKPDLFLSCPVNGSSAQPSPNFNSALINDLLEWVKAYQDPSSANAGSVIVPKSIANWASVSATDSRRGEYVHVKIVPLENLFCRVRLVDCASPGLINSINNVAGRSPYERNSWYTVNDGYGTSLEIQSNNGRQMPSNSPWRVKNDSDGYNDRSLYSPGSRQIESTLGTPNADDSTATFVLPTVPRYQLNAGGINTFSATVQTLDFYVLIGTRLRLYNGSGVLLRDENVGSDCTYKYWNATWAKSE